MEDTRQALMAAARDLLLEQGLTGLSMRKVGAKCGISAAAIYRHFADKDALLASLVSAAFSRFMGYLTVSLSASTPLARFNAMGRQYFTFAREQPAYYQLVFMTNCSELGFERLDAATRERAQGTFQLLVDRVTECQEAGVFQPGAAQTQAAYAWSSLHGVASLYLTGNIDEAQFETLIEAQLGAIELALSKHAQWPALPAPTTSPAQPPAPAPT